MLFFLFTVILDLVEPFCDCIAKNALWGEMNRTLNGPKQTYVRHILCNHETNLQAMFFKVVAHTLNKMWHIKYQWNFLPIH